jgi:hypothetical protein
MALLRTPRNKQGGGLPNQSNDLVTALAAALLSVLRRQDQEAGRAPDQNCKSV